MRTDLINEENINKSLAGLDDMLASNSIKVEDYLKIAILEKIYEILQEIRDKTD